MTFSRKVLLVLSVSALFAGPVAPVFHLTDFDAAYAKSGNGGGNGGGNKGGGGSSKSEGKSGGSKSNGSKSGDADASASSVGDETTDETETTPKGSKSRGAAASGLKGLNAAHANINAFENASPNSRVGRIATYVKATQAAEALAGELSDEIATAQDAVNALETMDDGAKLEAFGTFDQDAYDQAVAAVAPSAQEYDRLAMMTEEEALAEFTDLTLWEQAKEALADEKAIHDSLTKLDDAGKLAQFGKIDDGAYAAALAEAKAELDRLNGELTEAEEAALAAYEAMTDGRDLSVAAQDALAKLLEGKTLTADETEVVEEVLAEAE